MNTATSPSRIKHVICPACRQSTRVLETRRTDGGAAMRRRRECRACGHRFTTVERHKADPLKVVKRDGRQQRFDRAKLRGALLRAAHKRPVSGDDVERIVARVEAELQAAGGTLAAARIGELCVEELRGLDRGAWMQFAGTLPSPIPQNAASA